MKITKILSTVAAAAVATTALATSASAILTVVESNGTISSGTGMWLVQIYNVGNADEGKDAVDYGINFADTAYIDVTLTVAEADRDWFEGGFGGSVITSCGGDSTNGSHNWPSNEFWGVIDDDLGIASLATDKAVQFEKVGDYTYKGRCAMTDANCFFADSTYVQAGIQEWGDSMNSYTVVSFDLLDASENVIISFDGEGNATVGGASTGSSTTTGAVDTTAPTTGDKQSPDTGVEGVAAVAGLAVVAAGAVVLSKKRK